MNENLKLTTIFALKAANEIFVGKTNSQRLAETYRRHVRGEVRATRSCAEKGENLEMYILERAEMPPAVANQRVAVYVRYFEECGFEILNSPRLQRLAHNLNQEAWQLLEELKKETPQNRMERTRINNPAKANFGQWEQTADGATERINIRATPEEKARFNCLARDLQVTQREMFQILISKVKIDLEENLDWEKEWYFAARLGWLKTENQQLHRENAELKGQLIADKREALANKNAQIHRIQSGISGYMGFRRSTAKIPLSVDYGRYKNCEYRRQYDYPEKEGTYLFRPTDILTGEGRYAPLFVLGVGDNGKLLKFRYYPKAYYAGISPKNNSFWHKGTPWVIGCEQASDGSMDMVFALPLETVFKYDGPNEYGSPMLREIADMMHETVPDPIFQDRGEDDA